MMPTAHRALVKLSIKFGYSKADEGGLCHGVTQKWEEAYLLDRLSDLPSPGAEETKHIERIERIQERGDSLYQDIMSLRDNIKIRGIKFSELPKDEQDLLEIPAFYEQLSLYHLPMKYPLLFGGYYNQNDFQAVSRIAASEATKNAALPVNADASKEGYIVNLNSDARLYSESELATYLDALRAIFDKQQQSVVIGLGSHSHAISLGYNHKDKHWIFYNINQFPSKLLSNNQDIARLILIGMANRQSFFHSFKRRRKPVHGEGLAFSVKIKTLGLTKNANDALSHALKENTQNYITLIDESMAKKKDASNITLLWIACTEGHLAMVNSLLAKGAEVNQVCGNGVTSLYMACQNGHFAIVNALLAKGAEVNQVRDNGITPLYMACQNGHLAIVNALLAQGAEVNQARYDGVTPLYMACQNGHLGIVNALLAQGAEINQADNDGTTPLYMVCHDGHLGIVNALLAQGADINQVNGNGFTPLYIACQNGYLVIVNALLVKRADVNQASGNGFTPLYIACQNGYLVIVNALLVKRADVNQASGNGVTPLLMACQKSYVAIVDALLAKGADVNQASHNGITPLYMACYSGHLAIVNALLAKGANAMDDGATPLLMACQNGHLAIVNALLAKGANVNQAMDDGATLLFLACQNGHFDIAELLLKKNAELMPFKSTKESLIKFSNNYDEGIKKRMDEFVNQECFANSDNIIIYPDEIAIMMGHQHQIIDEIAAMRKTPDECSRMRY